MKIAIVTNFLYPDGLGGTELYCYQLANALIERGNEVYWFVPNFNKPVTEYEERGNGIKIVKFAGVDNDLKTTLHFTTGSFIKEMRSRDILIAHFNEFGGYEGISSELLAETKKSGIATIVTLHLANYVCRAGTLHYGGIQPCNGKIILNRCASCHLFSNMTSSVLLNINLTRIFDNLFKLGIVRSVPRIKKFISGVQLKETFISAIGQHADMIVSLTKWFREVLITNNIPANKITYIPQVSPEPGAGILEHEEISRKGFMFIGRVNEEKGVDMILSLASRLKKELPGVFIDIYGPHTPHKNAPGTYIADLNKFDNVRYKGVLPPGEVLTVMNQYKAVISPSRVAEMAPLIIMEANKLKVPVIASDVPGSAELIRQYDCGLIFKYRSADDLYKKMLEIENNIHSFSFNQPAENNFYHTAGKYEEVYAGCLKQHGINFHIQ